jgi:hypothetical protein
MASILAIRYGASRLSLITVVVQILFVSRSKQPALHLSFEEKANRPPVKEPNFQGIPLVLVVGPILPMSLSLHHTMYKPWLDSASRHLTEPTRYDARQCVVRITVAARRCIRLRFIVG